MSILDKVAVSISLGFVAICGILIGPVFFQSKVISKRSSPEHLRKVAAKNARLSKALKALTTGDEKRMPEVRAAIAELDKGSFYRPEFAKALDQRGDHATAFKLESERAHFLELSVPDDAEMSFYSALADKTGHPDEALWARGRIGLRGHFRVWEIGTLGALAVSRSLRRHSDEVFEREVNDLMQYGTSLYPAFGNEIEELRTKLLSSSTMQIQALHDELVREAAGKSVKP